MLEADIRAAYGKLTRDLPDASFAVRSSATAEDLPDASFAGQQETFLNIRGIDSVLDAIREVFASLYNDRAIAYRVHQGFAHSEVALSAGVQRMVRSDVGAAGVMFTMDTESGFDQVVFITSAYGLGETVVQGTVNPDEFYVYKPNLEANRPAILRKITGSKALKMIFADDQAAGRSTKTVEVPEAQRLVFSITDAEIEELARFAMKIEAHYQRPMDIEWGRDGVDGKLYILQARPETVKSRESADVLRRYQVEGMLAYGDDVEVFLSAYGDAPYHEADAAAFRALYDKFAPFAEAVAAFTEEDLVNDGFNDEFTHMFPNFFAAAIKARVIAKNALTIMEARDMDAELEPSPPEIDNVGMDPAMAVSSFEENLSTASKLYNAFTAERG